MAQPTPENLLAADRVVLADQRERDPCAWCQQLDEASLGLRVTQKCQALFFAWRR
jgi:hypothetical protein